MPDWKSYLRKRLSLPEMTGHREERIIAELADHLEDLYREALSRGASEEEAIVQAEQRLGNADLAASELIRSEPAHLRAELQRHAEQTEEKLRDQGGGWITIADLIRDLRVAIRTLAKRPLFSGIVVLVLALGIGASTAIFTLVDAIILSPLPFDEANRLVVLSHTVPGVGVDDAGQCAAWHFTYEDENRVFDDLGMYGGRSVAVTGGDVPEAIPALRVTGGVFRPCVSNPSWAGASPPRTRSPERRALYC